MPGAMRMGARPHSRHPQHTLTQAHCGAKDKPRFAEGAHPTGGGTGRTHPQP